MNFIFNSIQLKYIFPACGLLKSSPNAFVKKSEIEKSAIFADLEGALCRAFFDRSDIFICKVIVRLSENRQLSYVFMEYFRCYPFTHTNSSKKPYNRSYAVENYP